MEVKRLGGGERGDRAGLAGGGGVMGGAVVRSGRRSHRGGPS